MNLKCKLIITFITLSLSTFGQTNFQTHERRIQRGVSSVLGFLENPNNATSPFVCADASSEDLVRFCRVGSMGASPSSIAERRNLLLAACSSLETHGITDMERGQAQYMQAAADDLLTTG